MTPQNKTSLNQSVRGHTAGIVRCVAALLLAGAVSTTGCDTAPLAGRAGPGGSAVPADLEGPAAMPLEDAAVGDAGGGIARAIEEADIVKIEGDKLYALNRFKGLLIIDVADPDAPTLLGELDLRGRGVEMYVEQGEDAGEERVYILLRADFYYYPVALDVGMAGMGAPAGMMDGPMPPQPDFEGSQLAIVDTSDPTAPAIQGKLNLVGFAEESRRVGDVIYVIGRNRVPWGYAPPDGETPDGGFVASVNVADPNDIEAVERRTIAGAGLMMHVSQTSIFAAGQEYDFEDGETLTRIQVVDISDPAGTIALRGSVEVPGHIRNRFFMDDYEGVLRIATESWGFGLGEVRLFTYDLTDPDNITPLGQTQIIQGESLEAVRFDGPRGYVVTFLRTDPLFVLDLRDPANPAVTGHLEVPGFSTHIEPRGERLIAVGIDDTNGRRPAVSYYDVADPANPTELGRVVLGPPGSFTESDATYDEKAFKIVDELGLIAIPFKHVDYDRLLFLEDDLPAPGAPDEATPDGATPDAAAAEQIRPGDYDLPICLNAVQLVDFDDAGLSQRGWFEHRGRVQRVGVIGNRVFALSQVAFQTVDISDRDNPVTAGQADFFGEDDMPYYADDCRGYADPIDWREELDLPILIQVFLNGDLCGAISTLPALGLPAGLILMMSSRPPRPRRRDKARPSGGPCQIRRHRSVPHG